MVGECTSAGCYLEKQGGLVSFPYYNFLFVLPLLVILLVVWQGKRVVEIKEWEHKYRKWMKLVIGLLLVAIASWTILG